MIGFLCFFSHRKPPTAKSAVGGNIILNIYYSLFSQCYLAHCVCLHDSVIKFDRLYVACKIVDSFAWNTSVLCDSFYLLRCSYTDLFKCDRKSHFKAEVLYLFKLFLWRTLKYKLNQCTKGYTTAVVCVLDSQ